MTVITLIELAGQAVSVTSVSFPHRFLEELAGLVLASLVCTSPGCCSGHFTAKFIHRKERGKSKSNKPRSELKGGGFLEGWVGSGEEGRCLDSILLL